MKLKKVEFSNYKSIPGGESSESDRERAISRKKLDIERDITCLVGINESGKSNVLLGLEKAGTDKELTKEEYSRHKVSAQNVGNSPELILWFEPTKEEQKKIKSMLGHDDVSTIIFAKTRNRYRLEHPHIDYNNGNFVAEEKRIIVQIVIEEGIEGEEIEEEEINKEETLKKFAKRIAERIIEEGIREGEILERILEEEIRKRRFVQRIEELLGKIVAKTHAKDIAKKIMAEVIKERPTRREAYRKEVIEKLKKYIPMFLRFDSVVFNDFYLPLKGKVRIDELIAFPDEKEMRSVKNLLELGGIYDFRCIKATDRNEREYRKRKLTQASETINKIIEEFWPVDSVKVKLSIDGDFLIIEFEERGKKSSFAPEERSRGLQWALAFNVFFLAETKGNLRESVLLIDEPGIFLHIDAQNKLLEQTFKKIVDAGSQIIYTTHLPYLIDSRYPERIRILEKEGEDTVFGNKAWSRGEFGKIPEPLRTALGLRWSELFKLAEKNAVVEGASDQIILRSLYSMFGKDKEINFLPAYGSSKLPLVFANIIVGKKLYFGIVDGDVDMEKLRGDCALPLIKNVRVENIPTLTKNEDIITIEDIVPEDIFREAVFQVYKPYCDKLIRDELPMDFPRVEMLEEFFAKIYGEEKHELGKTDIAREIANILKNVRATKDEKWKKDKKWNTSKILIAEIEKKFNEKGRESEDSD